MIGVHAQAGEFTFYWSVTRGNQRAGARTECLACKAFDQFSQLFRRRCRNDD